MNGILMYKRNGKMNTERINYIDVAKGILILIVVIHHIPLVMMANLGISDPVFNIIDSCKFTYLSSFMPAFFVITGLFTAKLSNTRPTNFSSFCNDYIRYIFKNIKTIILPAFSLGAISLWIRLLFIGDNNCLHYINIGWRALFTHGGQYWFLSALFVAKIIQYPIIRYIRKVWLQATIYVILLIAGCLLKDYKIEPWFYAHAMMLAIFLFVGQVIGCIKIGKFYYVLGAFSYILMLVLLKLGNIGMPYITALISCSIAQLPLLMALGITGTLLYLGVSKLIDSNNTLQFYGKNSLVVFGLQNVLISIAIIWYQSMTCIDDITSMVCFMSVFFAVIILVALFIKLLNLKYINYCLGKF